MDINDLASFVAIILATISLAISLIQVRISKKSNMLPIIIEMINEFRSKEFKKNQRYILCDLDCLQGKGYRDLSEEEREHVLPVSYFFDHLGTLVLEKMIGKRFILTFMARSLLETWYKLSPLIYIEREKYWKTRNYKFQYGFEYLSVLAKDYLTRIEKKKTRKRFLPPIK